MMMKTKMTTKVLPRTKRRHDYLRQQNVHIGILLSASNPTLRTILLVTSLFLNPSILSLLFSPDPNANGVVVPALAEGVDIFPLIFDWNEINNNNNVGLMGLFKKLSETSRSPRIPPYSRWKVILLISLKIHILRCWTQGPVSQSFPIR